MDKQITFDISGMTCANCAQRIERGLSSVPGVSSATVNFAMETATIAFKADQAEIAQLVSKIENLGYHADIQKTEDTSERDEKRNREYRIMFRTWVVSALLSAPLAYTMVAHLGLTFLPVPALLMNPWWQLILAAPVQFIIGARFYIGAWRALRDFSANMDTLVALGTSAAFFYSLYSGITHGNHVHLYYETSAVLITLILFGKLLEMRARGRTSSAIRKLMQLQAKTARVERDGKELNLPLTEVLVGDVIRVIPGDTIPVDGIVLDGESAVNEAMITGESMPVQKQAGDRVIGATLNQFGTLRLRTEKIGADATLARIVRAVQEAQGSRAPIQRFADRVSGVFTPLVIVAGLLTFIAWFFVADPGNFALALENAIAVLVIACPCALGLATPTSIMVGSGRAAELGVLFRGGEYLEHAGAISVIALDKTGTVTRGEPQIISVTPTNSRKDENVILAIAASVERLSEHPLARAVTEAVVERKLPLAEVSQFRAYPGGGVSAIVEGESIWIGSPGFVAGQGIAVNNWSRNIAGMEEMGQTVIGVASGQELLGLIAIADQIRSETTGVIATLGSLGIQTVMVTGDNERTANAIAKQAGIKRVVAGVKPEEKAKVIGDLQSDGKIVAMVGDGINDAPALAVADVGIAMGGGSDIAIESADVALLGNDLGGLVRTIMLSRLTMRNIRQNLFWALSYNTLGIPLAAMGLLAPWLAGAAMALSSVSVTLNALRLQRQRLQLE